MSNDATAVSSHFTSSPRLRFAKNANPTATHTRECVE